MIGLAKVTARWSAHKVGLGGGRFFADIAKVGGGAAVGHGVLLLASPILSRIYSPEAFGILGLFVAATALMATSSCLKYDQAIVATQKHASAAALTVLSVLISLIVSIALMLILILAQGQISEALGVAKLGGTVFLVPVCVFAMGAGAACAQWAVRRRHFGRLAEVPIVRSSVMVTAQGVGHHFMHAGVALIVGQVLGHIVSTATLIVRSDPEGRRLLARGFRLTRLRAVFLRHGHFAKYGFPQELVNSASQQVPQFFLAAFFGPAALGYYFLTVRALQAPSALLGQAVRNVFYQRVSVIHHGGKSVLGALLGTTGVLSIVGAVVFSPFVIAGDDIFILIFGNDWRVAGEYSKWLSIWLFAGFINVPSVCAVQVLGKQRDFLIYEVALFIARNGALIVAGIYYDAAVAVSAFALIGAGFNLMLIVYVVGVAHRLQSPSPAVASLAEGR